MLSKNKINKTDNPKYMNEYMKKYYSNQQKQPCPNTLCDSFIHAYSFHIHKKTKKHKNAEYALKLSLEHQLEN